MKKLSAALGLSLMLSIPNQAFALEGSGIVYVDLQKALIVSDAGEKAKNKFSKKVEQTQKVIEEKQTELQELKESIEKKSMLLSEEARIQKEKEYQKSLRDYQRLIRDSQEELKREEAEISKKIIVELTKVVEGIAKEGNYTLIFEKTTSGILYAADAVDLTDKVVEAYNQQEKEK